MMTILDRTSPDAGPSSRIRSWYGDAPLIIALGFLAFIVLVVLFPELVARRSPAATNFAAMLKPPSLTYPFGTDSLGRDLFARAIYGARYSVLIGTGSVALALLLAVPLGILSGISRRGVDGAIVRILDVIGAFPELLLAILVVALLGPGLLNLIVAIGVASVPKFARVTRAQTRTVMVSGYVEHVRTLGQKRSRTILRHVLPNAVGSLPVLATMGLGYAIMGAAGLSFLGLGPQPPTPEWGLMLSEAISNLRIAWWAGVFPGALITMLVIALTVVGTRLQSIFEKRGLP
ncbi:ABC transporter permease (plasmid) [Microvirga sp. RSM25]|uniref:ABC transporter permease n=1 Tax=Microvirga sp. RSM25 TaxID=3273802 RepID=UPI00384F6DD2